MLKLKDVLENTPTSQVIRLATDTGETAATAKDLYQNLFIEGRFKINSEVVEIKAVGSTLYIRVDS